MESDITRIVITTDSDRFTITRSTVRYEAHQGNGQPKKWSVSSDSAEYSRLFHELCESVESLMRLDEVPADMNAEITTFTVMRADSSSEERTFCLPDIQYVECFLIINRMVKISS